ncbi:methyltransferase family protein [Tamaricihabitans halophyticus]|uniref:Methyltransferase family protein n=1 Tax=Tamaricihabitans halophyticus TaxID=1262583 RepID=A0A4R2R633_9PSEU|nr:class I SAM-dependent methyltransferase [Tamaricihabitans halophyticus]TCP57299.1 methyltransferase family protein [Tamaricihabitans halophyticus]
MVDSISRYAGLGASYDRTRPSPPPELVAVLRQWARNDAPAVVDLGAGTGLSTSLWAGAAARVVAIEPSPEMRAVAAEKLARLPDAWAFTVAEGTAEATGQPDESADVVTASQAMHWFDVPRALPEAGRLLRTGGVFAAYDCDWPPTVDWEVDAAFRAFLSQRGEYEQAAGLRPRYADPGQHLSRMRDSGVFRAVTELCVHSREQGDAQRLMDVVRSMSSTVAVLGAGASEDEIGLTKLGEVAADRLAKPKSWWWTYRVRLGVK